MILRKIHNNTGLVVLIPYTVTGVVLYNLCQHEIELYNNFVKILIWKSWNTQSRSNAFAVFFYATIVETRDFVVLWWFQRFDVFLFSFFSRCLLIFVFEFYCVAAWACVIFVECFGDCRDVSVKNWILWSKNLHWCIKRCSWSIYK